jgi:hypothetical protein
VATGVWYSGFSRSPGYLPLLSRMQPRSRTRFAAARQVLARRRAIIGPEEDMHDHVCARAAGIKSDVAMSPQVLF